MRISDWSSDVCSSDLVPTSKLASIVAFCDKSSSTVARSLSLPCSSTPPTRSAAFSRFASHRACSVLTPRSLSTYTAEPCISLLVRSEEHTSELQSLMLISYAVFSLQKKKTTKHPNSILMSQTYNNTTPLYCDAET